MRHHYFPKSDPFLRRAAVVRPWKRAPTAACIALITQAGAVLRIVLGWREFKKKKKARTLAGGRKALLPLDKGENYFISVWSSKACER